MKPGLTKVNRSCLKSEFYFCFLIFSRTINDIISSVVQWLKAIIVEPGCIHSLPSSTATSCMSLDKLCNFSVTYCLFPHLSNGNNRTSLIVSTRIVCFSTAQ